MTMGSVLLSGHHFLCGLRMVPTIKLGFIALYDIVTRELGEESSLYGIELGTNFRMPV